MARQKKSSADATAAQAQGERHPCDHPGCQKSYSRVDHLQRHKLNHNAPKTLQCSYCEKTFVRNDLLIRHESRHLAKGSENKLGRWSSNKRAEGSDEEERRDQELGNQDKSPQKSKSSPRKKAKISKTSEQEAESSDKGKQKAVETSSMPPPGSLDDLFLTTSQSQTSPSNGDQYPPSGPLRIGFVDPTETEHSHFSAPTPSGSTSIPYSPSTSTSNVTGAFYPQQSNWSGNSLTPSILHDSQPSTSNGLDPFSSLGQTPFFLGSLSTGQESNPFAPPPVDQSAEYRWLFDDADGMSSSSQTQGGQAAWMMPGFNFDSAIADMTSPAASSSTSAAGQRGGAGSFNPFEPQQQETTPGGSGIAIKEEFPDMSNALDGLAFFAGLQEEIPNDPAFQVDAATHSRLLNFLSSVQELPTSGLFVPSALRCYIYLFFRTFNCLYPLIHQPTFDCRAADPMLLSAIIVVGMHYADSSAHSLAVRIGRKLWGAFVSLDDFRPARATLPLLQAMLLTEAFGKLMSTRPLHEVAHLFHSFIIALGRRNAVFVHSPVPLPPDDGTETQWRAWAREEEKKRIAFFAFILDAQHAAIFRHVPTLSAFQIQLQLPASEEEFNKPSASEWTKFRKRKDYKSPNHFIPTLKFSLSPAGKSSTYSLDPFSRTLIIHGLMSISYDMKWKGNILLGTEREGSTGDSTLSGWRDKLSSAFSTWKTRLDANAFNNSSDSAQMIFRASSSLHTAAQITLFVEILDLQVFAGLPSVLGRFIGKEAFKASKNAVRAWAKTPDGRTAVWYACKFLNASLHEDRSGNAAGSSPVASRSTVIPSGSSQSHLNAGANGNARVEISRDVDDLLHHRWCQYLCALICWAYGQAFLTPRNTNPNTGLGDFDSTRPSTANNSARNSPEPSNSTKNPAGTAYLEAMCTRTPEDLISVDDSVKTHTKGVLEMVEKELAPSRWELGTEAAGVLRKLLKDTDVGGRREF